MAWQLYVLLYLFYQAELFRLKNLTSCLSLTYYFDHVTNWQNGGEFPSYWSVMQIYIYLATLGMIFLDFVFRRYKWPKVEFCWKNNLSTYEIFLWKEGQSFQMPDNGNNLPASKMCFCWMILLKTATNSSNNGYFLLNVAWHVTWPVRSTNCSLNVQDVKT